MSKNSNTVLVYMPAVQQEILDNFCKLSGLNRSDVIRRSVEKYIEENKAKYE